MKREKRALRAIHPGEFLREEVLLEMEISQGELARRLGVSRRAVNEIIGEKQSVSPEMALRLGRLFRSNPEFWLRLQVRWDLEKAERASTYKREVRPLPRNTAETVTTSFDRG